jgi:hypothetical protein
LVIFTTYTLSMIYVFVQIGFKMQTWAKILIFAFLVSFTIKAAADGMRVFRNKINYNFIATVQLITFISDRIKIFVLYFFVFMIR